MRTRILVPLLVLLAACAGATRGPEGPVSPRISRALAGLEVAAARNELGAVQARWQEAVAAAPDEPVSRFLAAEAAGTPEASFAAHRANAELDPADGWAAFGMARANLRFRAVDQAEVLLRRAEALLPDEPLVVALRAELLLAAGRPEESRPLLGRAGAIPEAHEVLATLHERAGDRAAARAALEAALALDADRLATVERLAVVCTGLGDLACTAAARERAALLVPRDPERRIALARALVARGGGADATAAVAAIPLDDRAPLERLRAVAELERAVGRGPEELALLERIEVRQPGDPATLRRIGELRFALVDEAGAERAYRGAIERAPEDPEGHLRLARFGRRTGDRILALGAYRAAVARGAGDDAAAELAELEAEIGKAPPIDGRRGVGVVAQRVLKLATAFAAERRGERRKLAGTIVAKVEVGPDGKATRVTLLADGPGDDRLAACVHVNLLDARYPAKAGAFKVEIPIR